MDFVEIYIICFNLCTGNTFPKREKNNKDVVVSQAKEENDNLGRILLQMEKLLDQNGYVDRKYRCRRAGI